MKHSNNFTIRAARWSAAHRKAALLGCVATVLLAIAGPATAAGFCPNGASCGTVAVPLDRAHPAAGKLDIAYALVPRRDTSSPSLGTVVPNPGGPGSSTIASAGLYLQAAPRLFEHRDLLLIDPRGTGASGALTCPSLAGRHPLDEQTLATICGADLGQRAGRYGSADVADDIDAVRASLGLDKLDLWGDSYGAFLMQVYAARHPTHVRSIVLDGAAPIAADPWGRDILRGVRRVIGLICTRTHHCSPRHVLVQIAELATRLRQHPVKFTAATPVGRLRLTLDERELANIVYGDGQPEALMQVPAAVSAATQGRLAPLKHLLAAGRIHDLTALFQADPMQTSVGDMVAVACHDYPRRYDLAASPKTRRRQYRAQLRHLDRQQFWPFSPNAWLRTKIDAGPKCLDWPADRSAARQFRHLHMPDIPVLVMSGELDTNTPVEQGRAVAAEFKHATFAIVANAGHTPALYPCGIKLGIDFVEHLRVDPNRCRAH